MICNLCAENPPPIVGPVASPISLSDSESTDSSSDSSTSNSSKETKHPAKVTCSQKRNSQPLAKGVTKKSKVLKPAVTMPEEKKSLSSLTLKNKKRKSPHTKAPCIVRRSQRKHKPSPSDSSSMSASDRHKETLPSDSFLSTHDNHKEVARSTQSDLNEGLQRGVTKKSKVLKSAYTKSSTTKLKSSHFLKSWKSPLMKHSPQKLKVPCTVRRSQRKHKLPPTDSRSDPVATDHNDGHEKSVTPDLNLHATKSISKESHDDLWILNLWTINKF